MISMREAYEKIGANYDEDVYKRQTEYRARLRPLKVEGEPHVLLMVSPIDEQECRF